MGSISTQRGDGRQTSLAGGIRVSKSSLRVENYGTVDELNLTPGVPSSLRELNGKGGARWSRAW